MIHVHALAIARTCSRSSNQEIPCRRCLPDIALSGSGSPSSVRTRRTTCSSAPSTFRSHRAKRISRQIALSTDSICASVRTRPYTVTLLGNASSPLSSSGSTVYTTVLPRLAVTIPLGVPASCTFGSSVFSITCIGAIKPGSHVGTGTTSSASTINGPRPSRPPTRKSIANHAPTKVQGSRGMSRVDQHICHRYNS